MIYKVKLLISALPSLLGSFLLGFLIVFQNTNPESVFELYLGFNINLLTILIYIYLGVILMDIIQKKYAQDYIQIRHSSKDKFFEAKTKMTLTALLFIVLAHRLSPVVFFIPNGIPFEYEILAMITEFLFFCNLYIILCFLSVHKKIDKYKSYIVLILIVLLNLLPQNVDVSLLMYPHLYDIESQNYIYIVCYMLIIPLVVFQHNKNIKYRINMNFSLNYLFAVIFICLMKLILFPLNDYSSQYSYIHDMTFMAKYGKEIPIIWFSLTIIPMICSLLITKRVDDGFNDLKEVMLLRYSSILDYYKMRQVNAHCTIIITTNLNYICLYLTTFILKPSFIMTPDLVSPIECFVLINITSCIFNLYHIVSLLGLEKHISIFMVIILASVLYYGSLFFGLRIPILVMVFMTIGLNCLSTTLSKFLYINRKEFL